MRSFRSRLILGSALIALVPLAVAMFLFARQVGAMMRAQGADRLAAALGGLDAQLRGERERIAEQLAALGRDPTLKRLYLVRPTDSRDLSDALAERRRLLGLGFLELLDPGGAPIAEASPRDSVSAPTMGASAPIPYQDQIVGTVRGGIFLDSTFLGRLRLTSGVELVLEDAGGRVLAATLPGTSEVRHASGDQVTRVVVAGRPYLGRAVPLELDSTPGARVLGLVSTAAADRAIVALWLTAALLGLAGLVIAIALGMLWSSQISGPVEELAAFSSRLAQGEWERPLAIQSVRELEILVEALDRMRGDLQAYRARLVVSERQAAWSAMARNVAHEIKNPLTPIAISVADLKRSYDQGRPDFPQILEQAVRTVSEEVATLKHLLQEFSEFARFPAPRPGPCQLAELITDLESLYRADVERGRLAFSRPGSNVTFTADAGQLKQALVNLIQNGLEALENGGRVTVTAATHADAVELAVADDGPGLTPEQRANLFVPGFTTKATGSGLGLTIVERIVSDHGGTIAVEPGPRSGTVVRIRLLLEPRS